MPTDINRDYGQVKKFLREDKGRLLTSSGAPVFGDRELLTFFPCPSQGHADRAVSYLNRYTSFQNDKTGPSFTVTDPVIGGEKMEGKWRLAGVRLAAANEKQKSERAGVVRALRFGWLTQIVADEWRSVSVQGDPQTAGYTMRRMLVAVAPSAVEDILNTLRSQTSVTNPKADGKTLDGKYTVPPNGFGMDRADDGTCNVWQQLTLTSTASTFVDITALTPQKVHNRKLVIQFSTHTAYKTGYTSSDVSEIKDGWVYRYRYLDPDNRDTIDAIPDSGAAPAGWASGIGTGAGKPFPDAYVFVGKELDEDETTRTLTLSLFFARDEAHSYQVDKTYYSDGTQISEKRVANALPAELAAEPSGSGESDTKRSFSFSRDDRGLVHYGVTTRAPDAGASVVTPADGDDYEYGEGEELLSRDGSKRVAIQVYFTKSPSSMETFLNGGDPADFGGTDDLAASGWDLRSTYDGFATTSHYVDGSVRLYKCQRVWTKDIY